MQVLSQRIDPETDAGIESLADNALKAWFAESLTRDAARPLFRLRLRAAARMAPLRKRRRKCSGRASAWAAFNLGFKALTAALARLSGRAKGVGVNARIASARCRDSNDIRIATCPASFYRDGTYKVIRLTLASA
ncbi:hypothetical protein VSR68_18010 [Paraburkholderia phymatum]|uniref:hypothetical protein n=1 Tax=Paraburkholderia phymatum TaxID=148447 RepID=UPI003170E15D